MLVENPELRRVGIAEAFRYAADNRARYADFFETTALHGPGFTADEAADLPGAPARPDRRRGHASRLTQRWRGATIYIRHD